MLAGLHPSARHAVGDADAATVRLDRSASPSSAQGRRPSLFFTTRVAIFFFTTRVRSRVLALTDKSSADGAAV